MKKTMDWISLKLTFNQVIVGWVICALVFFTIFIRIIEKYGIPIIMGLIEAVIFILMNIMVIIASYKLGENIIKTVEKQKIEDELTKDR